MIFDYSKIEDKQCLGLGKLFWWSRNKVTVGEPVVGKFPLNFLYNIRFFNEALKQFIDNLVTQQLL